MADSVGRCPLCREQFHHEPSANKKTCSTCGVGLCKDAPSIAVIAHPYPWVLTEESLERLHKLWVNRETQ